MGRQSVYMESRQFKSFPLKRRNGEGKGNACSQTGSSVSEDFSEEERDSLWKLGDWYCTCSDDFSTSARYNSRWTAWMVSVPLDVTHHPTHVVLDLGSTQSIGWRKAIGRFQKYALSHDIRTEFCLCNKPIKFCQLWDNVVGQVSFSDKTTMWCRIWVLHLNWIQKKLRSHVQLLACTLPKSNIPQMGHIVLDLTSFAYQPESRERLARPTKHVTYAMSKRKSPYPARVQEFDDDEDDKPLVRPDHIAVSEDDKPLVQLTSVLKRESSALRRVPTPSRRRKRPPVWRDPSVTLEQDFQEPRVSDQKKSRAWAKIQMVKLFRTLSTSCQMFATWRTLTWNTTTCPPRSSRKGQLTWTPWNVSWLLPACGEDVLVLQLS